ncbi:MAG: type II toxin-antitoxin system RelE/ParE family toxin [Caulobacteraceae bacterium]|nr:type II toxin-antitoxin system RelE/ParE family toxin [Caulobacteraceae bacterium]
MKRLAFAPAARADLMSIGRYIAEDDPARAESFVAELESKARQAAERPLSFAAREDLAPGLRAAIHGRYVLFFRDLAHEVRVVRVLHGARDLGQIFRV